FSSVVIFSAAHSLISSNLRGYTEHLWNLCVVLLLEPMSKIYVMRSSRILNGFWLVSSIIILTYFSGAMFTIMIKKPSFVQIESLEELVAAKLNIFVPEKTAAYYY